MSERLNNTIGFVSTDSTTSTPAGFSGAGNLAFKRDVCPACGACQRCGRGNTLPQSNPFSYPYWYTPGYPSYPLYNQQFTGYCSGTATGSPQTHLAWY